MLASLLLVGTVCRNTLYDQDINDVPVSLLIVIDFYEIKELSIFDNDTIK